MTKSPTPKRSKKEPYINLSTESPNIEVLKLFPPILSDLYIREEHNRQLMDPILEDLKKVLQNLSLNLGQGYCPNCSQNEGKQALTLWYKRKKEVITAGGIVLQIEIQYHNCSRCKHHSSEHHALTLPYGEYDRHIILYAVALYTCGVSYRFTRSLIYAQFHVVPSLSTLLLWVQTAGILSHKLNEEVLRNLKGIDITWDEFFLSIRDGKTEGVHSPYFATLFMELEEGAFLYGAIDEGKQTNRLIVESHLKHIKHHEPQNGVADGCKSYPGSTEAILPNMRFIRDPVHKARGVRKKKQGKKVIKGRIEAFKIQTRIEWEIRLTKESKAFFSELDRLSHQNSKNIQVQKILSQSKKDWLTEEHMEKEALEEFTVEQASYFKHTLHRSLYAAQAAAQLAQSKIDEKPPLDQPLTSCMIEGWNRVHRSREKRMLCYRSSVSFYALVGLLGLLHNIVGVGRGCIYDRLGVVRPKDTWNPFANFLPVFKNQSQLSPSKSTPFRQTASKYRQQHSHQTDDPSTRNYGEKYNRPSILI